MRNEFHRILFYIDREKYIYTEVRTCSLTENADLNAKVLKRDSPVSEQVLYCHPKQSCFLNFSSTKCYKT
ncbi:UNVERIFIED_CONTAM: hypothetical protein NCL1_04040 [Trichonephila clavipes]